jgi:hypothetical protein
MLSTPYESFRAIYLARSGIISQIYENSDQFFVISKQAKIVVEAK